MRLPDVWLFFFRTTAFRIRSSQYFGSRLISSSHRHAISLGIVFPHSQDCTVRLAGVPENRLFQTVRRILRRRGRLSSGTMTPARFPEEPGMPLLDHFNLPLNRTHPWRSFHGTWAAAMA